MSRRQPWRYLSPHAVIVARGAGRRWGNPFDYRDLPGGRAEAVELFAGWIVDPASVPIRCGKTTYHPSTVEEIRAELGGRDVACWCGLDEPCHGDVLLEIANHEGFRGVYKESTKSDLEAKNRL
jgi:hypothetical protein